MDDYRKSVEELKEHLLSRRHSGSTFVAEVRGRLKYKDGPGWLLLVGTRWCYLQKSTLLHLLSCFCGGRRGIRAAAAEAQEVLRDDELQVRQPRPLEYDGVRAVLFRNSELALTEPCPFCGKQHLYSRIDGRKSAKCRGGAESATAADGTVLLRSDGVVVRSRRHDPILQFVTSCTVLAPGATISREDFLSAYRAWCAATGTVGGRKPWKRVVAGTRADDRNVYGLSLKEGD
jgi:hypothetical protein